jgi:micrococcal nuclease
MSSTPPDWQMGRPPRRRPRTLWSDLAGLGRGFGALPGLGKLAVVTVAALLLIGIVSLLTKDDEPNTSVASRSSTTVRRLPTTTSSTLPPLPDGDDRTVKDVLDGDSFELTDGTKIRLIGIDAPDVETDDCYSAEATTNLRNLLPAGRNVRIAYDASRADRLGRTLAYVYRLPDGLFVNVALARDGFATQLTTEPNTMHAEAIGAATAEARNAGRGLWQACSTTTTAPARTATTAAPATTATTTSEATSTSVTPPTNPSTTPTTQAVPVVIAGTRCDPPGATAQFADGRAAVCRPGLLGSPATWQAA